MKAASLRLGNGGAIGAQVGRDIGWLFEALDFLPGPDRDAAATALQKAINIKAASLGPLLTRQARNDV